MSGKARLAELCESIVDCPHSTPVWTERGVVVLRNQNIRKGQLDLSQPSFTDEAHFRDRTRRAVPTQGDIVITREAPMGEVCMIPPNLRCCLGQRMVLLRPNREHVDPHFLLYALQTKEVQREISVNEGTGSTVSNLRIPLLQSLPIPVRPMREQQAIAHILGTLDDKIELNRRMNETLEAIASALFKSWFVDFDPVRAKAEGRDPGLPQHLADLFPDSFEDSELGEIPRGWKAGCVDDEFNLTMGQSPPGESYNESGEGMPFYQGRRDFGSRFPSRRVYCPAPTRFAQKGDTLISVRAPVGDINVAAEDCAIGRGVASARHKTGSRSYTYQFMRAQGKTFSRFEAEGTVFGSIGKKDFHAISCVIPPRPLVEAFEVRCGVIESRVEANEHESRTLAALRDTLLPKLISGELRVSETTRPAEAEN